MPARLRAPFGAALTTAFLVSLALSANVSATLDQWSSVGTTGANPALTLGEVYALAVHDDELTVAGDFANAGAVGNADSIAKWDGAAWSAYGQHNTQANGSFYALPATIKAIAFDGDNIYVGGNFLNADGVPEADRIAMWNATTGQWQALDQGLNGTVNAIVVSGVNVYVAGEFTDADGIPTADYVAKWSAGAWSNLGAQGAPANGALGGRVNALAMKDGKLHAGGLFTNADGNAEADYVAKWTGSRWTNLGGDGVNGALDAEVFALKTNGADLLVGGIFEDADSDPDIDHIASWTAGAWSGFDTDGLINNAVYAIETDGADTYIGGNFTDATGPTGDRVLKYDGTSWSPLGNNGANGAIPNNTVYALRVWDNELYVGGSFTDAMGDAEKDKLVSWGLPDFQPDGRVRNVPGSLAGNNKYNATGTNQTKTQSGPRGATFVYEVSIQNDSLVSNDTFTVHATGAATTHFNIKYFYNGGNITTAVNNGSHNTAVVAPGGTYVIRVEIKIKNTAPANARVSRLITISSLGDTGVIDAVKVIGER